MYTYPESHKALTLLREDPTRFATQGTIVESWRTYRGRRLGPYYRLTWRENRRQRSIYLGRPGPLVDEVRRLLHEAQTIRRMIREHRRRQAEFREHVIRPLHEYLKEIFRLFGNGLYLEGWQLRGTKTAGPRLTTADVPEHLVPKFPLPLPSFLTETEPHPHTNPRRERESNTPSPKESQEVSRSAESPRESVDQTVSHSSVTNLSGIHHPLPPKHGISELFNSVDQRLPWDANSHRPSPPQHRHSRAFLQFVDQKPPHSTRGPPKTVAITLRRDERQSLTRATHHQTPSAIAATYVRLLA